MSQCKFSEEEIMARKQVFMNIARSTIPNFQIDESNRELISNLFNYFNEIEGALDLQKGLWLVGDIGTGKSTLMRLFSDYLRIHCQGFKMHICSKVSNDYAMSGDLDAYTFNQTGYVGEPVPMCFDELGRETLPANHFGQKLNVMQHIFHVRYSLWQSTRLKTFVTTNCDTASVEVLYGDFIRDRVREMFNVVVVKGGSRRR